MNSSVRNFSNEVPIVLVHLGKKLPLYLKANLKYLRDIGAQVVLVTDEEKIFRQYQARGFQSYFYNQSSQQLEKLSRLLNHNPKFRDGFWLKALVRFFALEEMMKEFKSEKIIHLESDIWISKHFPIRKLALQEFGVAFPLASFKAGVPSVFYVSNIKAIVSFNTFLEQSITANPESTDMSVLVDYAKMRSKEVRLLPTSKSFLIRNEDLPKEFINTNDSMDYWNGVFDANILGQYFFGWDPRNERGYRRLFEDQQENFANPSKSNLKYRKSHLYISDGNLDIEIFNLHIHSKDHRVFFRFFFPVLIRVRLWQSKKGIRSQPTLEIVFRKVRSIKHSFARRLKFYS